MTCPHCQRELSEHTVDDGCLNAWAAEANGWKNVHDNKELGRWFGYNPYKEPGAAGQTDFVPSYTTDIAAAFALEESLPEDRRSWYVYHLWRRAGLPQNRVMPHYQAEWYLLHASPYHRTVAFIAAKGKDDA